MAMLKFEGRIGTNKVGSDCEFEFEVNEEDLPKNKEKRREYIEEMAKDAAFQFIDWSYAQVGEES